MVHCLQRVSTREDLSTVTELGIGRNNNPGEYGGPGAPSDADVLASCRSLRMLHMSSSTATELSLDASLPVLEQLSFAYCLKLRALPMSVARHVGLQELRLFYCFGMVELDACVGALVNLRLLVADRCTGLVRLSDELGNCTSLTRACAIFRSPAATS